MGWQYTPHGELKDQPTLIFTDGKERADILFHTLNFACIQMTGDSAIPD